MSATATLQFSLIGQSWILLVQVFVGMYVTFPLWLWVKYFATLIPDKPIKIKSPVLLMQYQTIVGSQVGPYVIYSTYSQNYWSSYHSLSFLFISSFTNLSQYKDDFAPFTQNCARKTCMNEIPNQDLPESKTEINLNSSCQMHRTYWQFSNHDLLFKRYKW